MTTDTGRLLELAGRYWRKACCAFGRHRIFVIGRCGICSDHVGCRDCYRQWGMNHDVRAFLPWSAVADFHIEHGYDPVAALRARAASATGEP